MSASVMGYPFEMPPTPSHEDISSIVSDRPIKALPKRSIRERLSPQVASTIRYPPAPKVTAPIFQHLYTNDGRPRAVSDQEIIEEFRRRQRLEELARRREDDIYLETHGVSRPKDQLSQSNFVSADGQILSKPSDTVGTAYRYVQKTESSKVWDPSMSATSSVDGYESFENTNNKKKRKIPTLGDGLGGMHMSDNLAAYSQDDINYNDVYKVASPIVRSSLSTPRRDGGDSGLGRSYHRPLSDINGRSHKQRQHHPSESSGIISAAIAQAERAPTTPTKGQENISLLASASNSTPASANFTFTCDSSIPAIPWPLASDAGSARLDDAAYRRPGGPVPTPTIPMGSTNSISVIGEKPRRRKRSKKPAQDPLLKRHEVRRQLQQAENNRRSVYQEPEHMCCFCIYKMYTGEDPIALIRLQERKEMEFEKDAAQRKKERDKRMNRNKKGHRRPNPARSHTHGESNGVHGTDIPENDLEPTDAQSVTFEGPYGTCFNGHIPSMPNGNDDVRIGEDVGG